MPEKALVEVEACAARTVQAYRAELVRLIAEAKKVRGKFGIGRHLAFREALEALDRHTGEGKR